MDVFSRRTGSLKRCSVILTLFLFSGSQLFVASFFTKPATRYRCTVTSPWGTYRGTFNASALDGRYTYCSFRDIPYAVPPIGSRRFAAPILAKPLGSHIIYDATQDKAACPQSATSNPDTSPSTNEDCLYLNVYTPYRGNVRKNNWTLPVIVWTHGGAFTAGSKRSVEYGPDYFMRRGVVLVAINYRLGALGFLNLGTSEAPGNLGIRDQVVALQWIKKNIRSFGGDPNRITSMGQSAGGTCVVLQYLTPKSRGLIDKVIVQGAKPPPYLIDDAVQNSIDFATFVGFKGSSSNRTGVLRYLRNLTVPELVDAYQSYQMKEGDASGPLGPSRDYDGPDPVFPDNEEELGSEAPNIPSLFNCASADGTAIFNGGYPYSVPIYETVNRTIANLGSSLTTLDPVFAKNNETLAEVVEKVLAYFYDPRKKNSKLDKTVRLLSYFYHDPLYAQISLFSNSNVSNNIWVLYFDYGLGYRDYLSMLMSPRYADEITGASHCEDLRYLFFGRQFPPHVFQATRKEYVLIDRMTTWWTNFAKTGSPNSKKDSITLDWRPVTSTLDNYLWIQNSSEPVFVGGQKVEHSTRNFFNELREYARKS